MPNKGYVSEFMNGGRVIAHGKIEDLSGGFKLPDNSPFTIYVRPKFSTSTPDTVISVKCYQDNDFSDAPVVYNDWSPLAITEIAANTEILAANDIYWGSGSRVEGSLS